MSRNPFKNDNSLRLTVNSVYAKLLHQGQCSLREFLPAGWISGYLCKGLAAFATAPNR